MRKLITGASIILIIISIYGLLRTVVGSPHRQLITTTAVATIPTPSPDLIIASATPPPDPSPQSTPTPTPALASTIEPLKNRVVKHQPDQFRKDAISKEELSAIKKVISTIPWSRNSNPKEAANEDYAAIVKECAKSRVPDLLIDVITEATSNDYQPNNEAANIAYSTELNSDFENGDQSDSSNGKSAEQTAAGQESGVESGSTPAVSQPNVPANATSASSPTQQPTPPKVNRSKRGHAKHRPTAEHKVVDAKTRLIALWHKSLAPTEKSPVWTLYSDPQYVQPKK
jgi:hypothetical protein